MVLIISIIKKITAFIAAFMFTWNTNAFAEATAPNTSAESVCLMCSGNILYEKNADRRMPMASTTKLMTAIVALECCHLDENVEIRAEDCTVEGSSMYLKGGDRLSVEELLKGLLLVSGNDAAKALARYTAGSEEKFAELMNKKADDIGMTNTHFTNPHGLSDKQHYSTAHDMALLMEYCMKNNSFREINGMKTALVKGQTLINHNKLLFSCKGCSGGKTGFTEAAGRCLVSSCKRNDVELVCVTLSAPDDWKDHAALYNWAFSEFELRNVTDGLRFPVPLISDDKREVFVSAQESFCIPARRNAEVTVKACLPWFVFPPVSAGEIAGKALVEVDGASAGEYYLVYNEDSM